MFIAKLKRRPRGHLDSGEANRPASGREWQGREEVLEEVLEGSGRGSWEEVRKEVGSPGGGPEEEAETRSGRRKVYEVRLSDMVTKYG